MNGIVQIEVPDLPVIGNLLDQCFREANVSHRLSKDEALAWVHDLVASKKGLIYTDTIDNPTMLVCVGHGEVLFPREKPLVVFLVYILPEHRSHQTFRRMVRVIEGFATTGGYTSIYASEWVYGDTPGIGPLWESVGFKQQERVYVKLLD